MNRLEKNNDKLLHAVAAIKEAILQGQYEAAKGLNRILLAVYYCIGKYVSLQLRKDTWGSGALETISGQLCRELPELRGFSATQLKEMRLFYEAWIMLDTKSSVVSDILENPAIANVKMEAVNPSVALKQLMTYNGPKPKEDEV